MTNMYKNTRKEDLVNLLIELGESVSSDETIVQLKTKIETTQFFKDNAEMVADLLNSIVEDRKNKMHNDAQKLELEKVKLAQIEKQLQLETLRAENQNKTEVIPANADSTTKTVNNLENLLKSVKVLTIPVPDKPENFNLFFQTLERAFKIKNVPEDFKAEILLNILGEKLNHILYYINDEEIKSYETVKTLVLREYQPTPRECLLNFRRATREPKETFVQFASRLNALFHYYLKLRKVNTFDSLCELMVADKLFQTLDRETATHISTKQGEGRQI